MSRFGLAGIPRLCMLLVGLAFILMGGGILFAVPVSTVSCAKAGVATASVTIPIMAIFATCMGLFLLVTGWGRDRPWHLLSVRRI